MTCTIQNAEDPMEMRTLVYARARPHRRPAPRMPLPAPRPSAVLALQPSDRLKMIVRRQRHGRRIDRLFTCFIALLALVGVSAIGIPALVALNLP